MCLYMSVPQWLNLQNFLKAINQSVNHTIDVTVMFIYLKCLNSSSTSSSTTSNNSHKGNNINNNNNNNKVKNQSYPFIKTVTTTNNTSAIVLSTNLDKNHEIDFNANITQINIENLRHLKTNECCCLKENIFIKQQQQKHHQHHHHHEHFNYCHGKSIHGNSVDQLQMLDKLKTFPLHI